MKKARKKTRARLRNARKQFNKRRSRKFMKRYARGVDVDAFNPFRRVQIAVPPPSLGRGWCKKCKASALCAVRPPTQVWRCKTCNRRAARFPMQGIDYVWGIRRCPKRKARLAEICPKCTPRAPALDERSEYEDRY